jgi:hypothetical protein
VLARRDRRSIGIRLDRLHVVVGRPKLRLNSWTSTRATTGPGSKFLVALFAATQNLSSQPVRRASNKLETKH